MQRIKMQRCLPQLEEILLRDPGARGIAALACPGHLHRAANLFCNSSSILVLTGFPCCMEHTPPTENDGISGACAIARAASLLGKKVTVVTDECNESVLRACLADGTFFQRHRAAREQPMEEEDRDGADDIASMLAEETSEIGFKTFPPSSSWRSSTHGRELRELASTHKCYIAIERVGRGRDGSWYTMGAKKMDHLVAPLDPLFESLAEEYDAHTIGIGDGGNELGMGTVEDAVRNHIPHGKTIACRGKSDALIAAGVSNWGGWGLLGAAWLQHFTKQSAGRDPRLCPLLPSASQEQSLLVAQANAGARDGTTGQIGDSVDGLPREIHENVLQSIHSLSMSQGAK